MRFINKKSSTFAVFISLMSQGWTAITGLIFTPIYIKLIGVESFGLVAFYTSLVTSLTILDFGLSTAVSRQLAIMRAESKPISEQRNLLCSIERIYWVVALILGLCIMAASYPIAAYWINSRELPVSTIQHAVLLMGLTFVFQWPNSIYTGSLAGLQRQTKSATVIIIYTTMRVTTMVLALTFISSTIECFFIVQTAVTALQSLMLRFVTWKELRLKAHRPVFSIEQLKTIKKFAAGITGISIVSFALMQIDKIIVSKMVLLEYVGYYNLAFVLANIMMTIISPMQNVFFPRFTSLAAAGKKDELYNMFKKTGRWIGIIVIPIGVFFVVFGKEVLLLWTKNADLAEKTSPILKYVAVGTVCNTLMWVPYFFMLAKGITRFTIIQNIIASLILTPLLFWWTGKYGALGASWVWFTVNAGYIVISLPVFHYLYLKGHTLEWYWNNLIKPSALAIPIILLMKYVLDHTSFHYTYFNFGSVFAIAALAYAVLTAEIRQLFLGWYHNRISR